MCYAREEMRYSIPIEHNSERPLFSLLSNLSSDFSCCLNFPWFVKKNFYSFCPYQVLCLSLAIKHKGLSCFHHKKLLLAYLCTDKKRHSPVHTLCAVAWCFLVVSKHCFRLASWRLRTKAVFFYVSCLLWASFQSPFNAPHPISLCSICPLLKGEGGFDEQYALKNGWGFARESQYETSLSEVFSTHLTRFRFALSALSSKERAVLMSSMLWKTGVDLLEKVNMRHLSKVFSIPPPPNCAFPNLHSLLQGESCFEEQNALNDGWDSTLDKTLLLLIDSVFDYRVFLDTKISHYLYHSTTWVCSPTRFFEDFFEKSFPHTPLNYGTRHLSKVLSMLLTRFRFAQSALSSKERAVLMSRMLRKTGVVLLEIVNMRHLAKVLSTHLTRFRFAQSALSSKESYH